VKVGRRATIKEREVRFEEEVLHHLSSSAAFVGAPLLTLGIEISQKQNRRRELTNEVIEFSDIACYRGGKIYGTYGYSFMASSPFGVKLSHGKCHRLHRARGHVRLLLQILSMGELRVKEHKQESDQTVLTIAKVLTKMTNHSGNVSSSSVNADIAFLWEW